MILLGDQSGLRRDIRQRGRLVSNAGLDTTAFAVDLLARAGLAGYRVFVGANEQDIIRTQVVDGPDDGLVTAADGAEENLGHGFSNGNDIARW